MTLLPENIKSLILDMDGVLWTDTAPIGDLPGIFDHIRKLGLGFAMATNNSSRTVTQYVERLAAFGVQVEPWQVVTSSLAVASLMTDKLPAGAPVFAIGEQGLRDALKTANFEVLPVEQAEKAEAVVMGIDWSINYEKMREATLLVRSGKPFFATNPDLTFPSQRGQIPGAGAWIAVVVAATDIQPIYAGKPYPFILEMALKRLGSSKNDTLIVGDRLETDIAGGQALGCPTALVLSGISKLSQARVWPKPMEIIADDLASLVGFIS